MAFSREDLTAYESKPQVQDPNHDPWTGESKELNPESAPVKAEADVDAAIAASVTESTDTGTSRKAGIPPNGANDGSNTTEPEAEPVAAEDDSPEVDKDPELDLSTDGAKPRSRAQERIEELVAERNALRKYGEYLLAQVESQRKAPTKTETVSQTEPTESNDDLAPTLESAEFDPIKLNKLQNEWIQRQVDKRVDSAVKQIENRQSETAVRQAFEKATAEFRKSAPDFDLVISNPQLPTLAPMAAKVVIRSDNGPAIAYHLAKNPDLAVRISRMEPESQAAAIGRLEEQLIRAKTEIASTQNAKSGINADGVKEPSKQTVKTVTKAPPPPKPVSGGTAPVQKDSALMSMEEWVANERSKKIAERSEKLKLRQAMRR